MILHDTALSRTHIELIGGVPVMTPQRTMVDLALGLHRDESLRRWMLLLADTEPALVSVALSEIDTMIRVPGKRAGRGALERLLVRTR